MDKIRGRKCPSRSATVADAPSSTVGAALALINPVQTARPLRDRYSCRTRTSIVPDSKEKRKEENGVCLYL